MARNETVREDSEFYKHMMECEGQGSVSIKEIAEEEGQKMEEIEKAQKVVSNY